MRRLPKINDSTAARRAGGVRGFSLVDVLVSMAVVVVLLAILAPALSGVREATRRVVCGSNIRQIGLGLAMYRHTYRDSYPDSRFVAKADRIAQPQAMMTLRITNSRDWDGLGLLFYDEFLDAPGVFYCPSHHGRFPASQYSSTWGSSVGQIVGNYHYRGESGGLGAPALSPATAPAYAVVSDGMASRVDFNHIRGCNVLRDDFSVSWFQDADGGLFASLSEEQIEGATDSNIPRAWQQLDGGPEVPPTR